MLLCLCSEVRKIDEECADLLEELINLHKNPKSNDDGYNIELFAEYLQDHPESDILILLFGRRFSTVFRR